MMNAVGRWLLKAIGVPLLMAIAKRTAAAVRLKIRQANREELISKLKEADTPKEKEDAAQAIIDHFNNSDK